MADTVRADEYSYQLDDQLENSDGLNLEPRRRLRRSGSSRSSARSSYSSYYSSRSSSSFSLNFGYRTYGFYYSYAYYGNMYKPTCFPEDKECLAAVKKQRTLSIAFLIIFISCFCLCFCGGVCCALRKKGKRTETKTVEVFNGPNDTTMH